MTPRWRLFSKYLALIVALVSLALLASGGISLYFSHQENQAHLVALQQEKATAAALRIEQYIRDLEEQLGWTALPAAGTGSTLVEQRRFEYLKLLRQVPAITEVSWIDNAGREQLKVSRLAMDVVGSDTDYSKESRFTRVKDGRSYFSPVYFRKETEPYLTISRPAGGRGGGVTVAEVNLKFVWEVVSQIRIGKAGLAYVVNSEGILIAHPDISLVLQRTDLNRLPQVAGLKGSDPAAEAEGGIERRIAKDLKGHQVLIAHAPIPTLDWNVLVEVPLAEAFEPLYASLARTGLLLLLGFALSVVASVFLARRMVSPIRVLQEGAAQIGAGKLNQKIDVRTGDELEALGEQFNMMAAELKASYAGLERKVEERTAELRETLEQQTATAEILRVISGSPTDIQPVMDAVAASAARLCDASDVIIRRVDGDAIYLIAHVGSLPVTPSYGLEISHGTFMGHAIRERRTIHIHDVLEPHVREEYPQSLFLQREDPAYRTVLATPLLREDTAIGVIIVRRPEVHPFSDKQVKLLETFAAQAVIAIENVRLFNEIQDKSRQLEIASKHKSEFLANMSHELRTPLNAIIGFSEALLEKMFGEVNAKQEDYLKDIHSSGRHLLSLINDILDLSKVEAGRMELEPSVFHLPSALQNAMTLVRERAQNHGIALKLQVDPQLNEIRADERKFKQIMLNLLSNAVKFTPDGGRVEVDARMNGDAIDVSVKDTGVGIAPEDRAAVFEEFRQVGRHYTNKHEGTGLGLALTRRFVEMHGGTIRLESEPGKGSTFTFTLPLR